MAMIIKTHCDCCGSDNIKWKRRESRRDGWPYVWTCYDCRAEVGCCPNTNVPLGKMANATTRRLRRYAHEAFDEIWKRGLMSRYKAYEWLCEQLDLTRDERHISMLTDEQLKSIPALVKEHFGNVKDTVHDKRKERARAKREAIRGEEAVIFYNGRRGKRSNLKRKLRARTERRKENFRNYSLED